MGPRSFPRYFRANIGFIVGFPDSLRVNCASGVAKCSYLVTFHLFTGVGPYLGALISVIFYDLLKGFDYNSIVFDQDADHDLAEIRPIHIRVWKFFRRQLVSRGQTDTERGETVDGDGLGLGLGVEQTTRSKDDMLRGNDIWLSRWSRHRINILRRCEAPHTPVAIFASRPFKMPKNTNNLTNINDYKINNHQCQHPRISRYTTINIQNFSVS